MDYYFSKSSLQKKKIAVTVVIITKQKRTYYELLWLKCKEGGLCVSNISELSFFQDEMLEKGLYHGTFFSFLCI